MPKLIAPDQLLQIGITRKQLERFHQDLGEFLGKKGESAAKKSAADTSKKPQPAPSGNKKKPKEAPKPKEEDK